MSLRRVTASLATLGLLAGAPTALAGTVSVPDGFQAAPGEKNDVTVQVISSGAGGATVVDLGAPLIVGDGCTAGTPVFCSGYPVTLHLGDRADRGDIRGNWRPRGTVYGEEGADVIHADGLQAFAYGGPGADVIRVTAHSAIAQGGPGGDTIFGDADNDQSLYGEGGRDHLQLRRAGGFFSVLDGGPGSDTLAGLGGARLFGGDGHDGLWTTDGRSFTAEAGAGRDFIIGGNGKDTIDAGPGADFVQVAPDGFADTVVCGTGNDTVRADPLDTVAADCEQVTVVGG
jgi:Ca2+-binding RTX toxin-like protein